MKKPPANLTSLLRDTEFTYVGVCADGSVRVGCKGTNARAVQFPATHAKFAAALALVEISDADAFESAVMGFVQ